MNYNNSEHNNFTPIFVVGAPRSGTTMLAVLLDRHSRIAVPPETNFFSEFIPQVWENRHSVSYEQMVDSALEFKRISDLNLDRSAVLQRFKSYEKSFPNLLGAILETYASINGKVRPAEKSPKHIEHVPTILEAFPKAKVICIIRDGRDVVRSLLKVPWAEPGNPRRFGLFCREWSDLAKLALKYSKTYSKQRFIIVKYENLILNNTKEMKRLCEFVEERFESVQLNPEVNTNAVPSWERDWKGKASKMLDPSRVEAWRNSRDQNQIWAMNSMMGRMLEALGYPDVNFKGCPVLKRIKLAIRKIPFYKPIRPISLMGLRLLRIFYPIQ